MSGRGDSEQGRAEGWGPGPGAGRAGGAVEAVRMGERSAGGRAPPSWRGELAVRGRRRRRLLPSPLFSHPHPAARPGMRKVPANEKGGGPRQPAIGAGRALFPLWSRRLEKKKKSSSGRPRPACSRPAVGSARPALQRRPRVHRMWLRGEAELAGGLERPDSWVCKWGLRSPNALSP